MKKILSLMVALALAAVLACTAFAALDLDAINGVGDDLDEIIALLTEQVGAEEMKKAVIDFFTAQSIPSGADADDLPANAGEALAASLADKFNFSDTDLAERLSGMMSNEFVSFLAKMYIPVDQWTPDPTQPKTTTQAPAIEIVEKTGDSSLIAVAASAAFSAAAASAFVVWKKKEA